MTYDLRFVIPPGQTTPTGRDVTAFLGMRHGYTALSATEVGYSNTATGVYFSFYLDDTPPEDGHPEAGTDVGVAFSLNLNRPSVFAAEAAEELVVFVDRFGLLVDDPQSGTVGVFDPAGFVDRWRASNASARQVTGGAGARGGTAVTVAAAALQRVWRWNRALPQLRSRYRQQDIFVPTIVPAVDTPTGRARFVAVVGVGRVALPEVDLVVLPTRQWPWPRPLARPVAVDWFQLEALHLDGDHADDPVPHTIWPYRRIPRAVIDLARRHGQPVSALRGVHVDCLTDE